MAQLTARSRAPSLGVGRSDHDVSRDRTLPPALALSSLSNVKCLHPVEHPLSHDGELSARNAQHRTPEQFQAVIQDTTWLLQQALTPSGRTSLGNSPSDGLAASGLAASGHGSSATASSGASGPSFYPSAKSRRHVMAQSQRAYSYFRLHDFARAIKDYDACIACEPTSALLYYNRGCTWYAWQKKERAIQDFTRALKLDCKNTLYVESRATVSKELGRFQEAIQDYTWLDTLRRMAQHASTPANKHTQRKPLSQTSTARSNAEEDDQPPSLTGMRGSFSMSFSELQVSLMGAAISGDTSSSTTAPLGSSSDGLTTEERESQAMDWLIRFLQRSPRSRKRRDVRDAVQTVKTWSFFRGMDTAMIEQCLEDATYASFDSDAVVVEQGHPASFFHVVLNPRAPFVKNIDSTSGVSKLRELKKLSQGDAVGTDAYVASFADGTLRTIKHEIAVVSTGSSLAATRLRTHHQQRHHGSLQLLLGSQAMLSMLSSSYSSAQHHGHYNGGGDGTSFLPPEPASFTTLDTVHCLLLEVEAYRDILHDHEEAVLEERVAFLRGCRVFHGCSDDVLTALAAVSGARVYDPGKDLLRLGDEVTQLCVIKRGVCQVRKTISVPATKTRRSAGHDSDEDDASLASSRSNGDGSWVLDNGWMLTNPRLVNNASALGKDAPLVTQEVNIGVLASGQVYGELSVLQPGQSSQVTIHSQTLVEVLLFQQSDLARLNIQYRSGTMNALQDSLLFHNPPQQKIVQLQRDLARWEKQKRTVLSELSLQLPTKAQSVIRGAACMVTVPMGKNAKPQSPMRRRASVVLSPMNQKKSDRLSYSHSLPRL